MSILYRFLFIILFAIIGAGAGFGLSYTQTEQWKITAQFEQPTTPDLGNYYSLLSTYNFLNTNNQEKTDQKESVELVYTEFKRNLMSADLLKSYLEQAESVKLKAQVKKKSVVVVASELAEQFRFQKDPDISVDNISLISDNAEEAKQLLTGFILLANAQAREKLNADLITKWKVLFQQIKTASELSPSNKQGEISWANKLKMMQSVQPLDDNLITYRLVKSPSVSLKPEAPNRLFWTILGAIIALILGLLLSFIIKTPVKN